METGKIDALSSKAAVAKLPSQCLAHGAAPVAAQKAISETSGLAPGYFPNQGDTSVPALSHRSWCSTHSSYVRWVPRPESRYLHDSARCQRKLRGAENPSISSKRRSCQRVVDDHAMLTCLRERRSRRSLASPARRYVAPDPYRPHIADTLSSSQALAKLSHNCQLSRCLGTAP